MEQRAQWDLYGRCTSAESAVAYLGTALQLDQAYPLPRDLPASVDRDQLAAAVEAAFGAAPYIACSGCARCLLVGWCLAVRVAWRSVRLHPQAKLCSE